MNPNIAMGETSSLSELIAPLQIILDGSMLPFTTFIFKDYILDEAYGEFVGAHPDFQISNTSATIARELGLIGKDIDMFNKLASIEQYGRDNNEVYLGKLTNEPYVQRTTVLIFYIALALILLPITYIVIKRKDFR